jgi:hypothetical protein
VKGAKWPEVSFAAHALTCTSVAAAVAAGAIIFLSFLPNLPKQNETSNLWAAAGTKLLHNTHKQHNTIRTLKTCCNQALMHHMQFPL